LKPITKKGYTETWNYFLATQVVFQRVKKSTEQVGQS